MGPADRYCTTTSLSDQFPPSCSPKPLGSLDQANVRRLELVQTYTSQDGGCVQKPVAGPAQVGVSLLRNVVDNDGLDTHVRVDEQGSGEQGIQGGVQGAGGEGRD